ncbi:MAG: hypothetical protein ACI35Y_00465 [Candidatus Limimorpha sp.]|nr:hypothetical protein [Bacteroidales bacterium]MDD5978951.1 hypothetical protein [Bacteroidales bacterium]MDD7276568.1 hypothetical protein [Bacteroidales bacterium]MDY6075041.1 hypothetical protein [Bacteroidales bacterium]
MIRKFFCIVPVLLLALCFEVKAQLVGSLGDVQKDERELYTMTKQMTQFIRRFNYEEDRFGNKIFPDDPEYRNLDKRKDILPLLFDLENPRTNGTLRDYFVEDLLKDNNQFLEFLGGKWFSEVSAKFIWKGKEVDVSMIMAIEKEGLGSKWVLTNVFFSEFQKHFPQGDLAEREKHFIHPMSHELDFMNIYKIFKDPQIIEYYSSNEYSPDYLSLFFYEIKQGNLKFDHVENVKFHIFQIKNWYFEVSWFNRSGYNSGWLISNLVYLKEDEKDSLIKLYQPRQ